MYLKLLYYFVFVILLTVGNTSLSNAQDVEKERLVLNRDLSKKQIKSYGLHQFIGSISTHYSIPIGLEVALKDEDTVTYQIDFQGGNVSFLLNQIMNIINTKQEKYMWEIKNGVVLIFPKEKYRDSVLSYILQTKVQKFDLKEKTTCEYFIESLLKNRQIKKVLKDNNLNYQSDGFTGIYIPQLGQNFTIRVSQMDVKNILNKVVTESPTGKMWYIKRNNNDLNTFSLGIYATAENSYLTPTPLTLVN